MKLISKTKSITHSIMLDGKRNIYDAFNKPHWGFRSSSLEHQNKLHLLHSLLEKYQGPIFQILYNLMTHACLSLTVFGKVNLWNGHILNYSHVINFCLMIPKYLPSSSGVLYVHKIVIIWNCIFTSFFL